MCKYMYKLQNDKNLKQKQKPVQKKLISIFNFSNNQTALITLFE